MGQAGPFAQRELSAACRTVRDVTNVWQLSNLLVNAPSGDAEQLEQRCKIMLARCDDWRGVMVSLASRLVTIRELQQASEEAESNRGAGSVERSLQEVAWERRERARQIAVQTLQIFVPLAHR